MEIICMSWKPKNGIFPIANAEVKYDIQKKISI